MNLPEQYASALCIWREARGESFEAQRAVFHVLQNRVTDKRWPNTFTGVILQPHQFSSFNGSDPNSSKFPALEEKAWISCCEAVESPGEDCTQGATHYESIADAQRRPAWCNPLKITATIGAFRFYRL
jgi:spore germination cell wall hydrolase CwlJ-like protein